MFQVEIDDDAKPLLAKWLADFDVPGAFVVINRVGPLGDVVRGADGKAVWSIRHPHPWEITLGSKDGVPESEFLKVGRFRVALLFLARADERGVRVCVRDGKLQVESLP